MEKSNIKVSVIIPTYNRCELLKLTIESVLSQTYKNYELLICDDGSTDHTKLMVMSYKDERIRWLPGLNSGGPAVPRNRGIVEAKGEWLAFLDSDDLWKENKLETQLRLCDEKGVLAICSNANSLILKKINSHPYFNLSRDLTLKFEDMVKVNWVICSSMMIHGSLLQHVGNFPEDKKFKAIEDYALWINISILTKIYLVSMPLVVYRDEPYDSIRGNSNITYFEQREIILKYALLTFKKFIKCKSIKKHDLIKKIILTFVCYAENIIKKFISTIK